jgi:hypothetical protein
MRIPVLSSTSQTQDGSLVGGSPRSVQITISFFLLLHNQRVWAHSKKPKASQTVRTEFKLLGIKL